MKKSKAALIAKIKSARAAKKSPSIAPSLENARSSAKTTKKKPLSPLQRADKSRY